MENLEYIESYIQGRLSVEEQQEFERKLAEDNQFKNEYEQTLQIITAIEADGLRNELGKFHIDQDDVHKIQEEKDNVVELKPKNNIKRFLLIAASLLILITAGMWVFNQDSKDERFMAEVFYTDPGLPTPMSNVNHYNFYDAMVDYKAGDYSVALDKWNAITDGIGKDTLAYYRAMALLQLDKNEEANSILTHIDTSSDLFQKAQWRKIEALIKEGNLIEAQTLLKTLPENLNPEYNKVKDFLKTNM